LALGTLILDDIQLAYFKVVKIVPTSNIARMETDTILDLKEARYQTINGLSIGTMNFDPG